MKVTTILGARPQFIKAAVVSRAITQTRSDIQEKIIHTGQHFDNNMSDIFFDELDIPRPHVNLRVGGGGNGQNTGRMLEKLEASLIEDRPDWVLVYGDTDSTLAGALAAAKLDIPVAHVEAGLRSYNRKMPEEINRVLVDHLSTLLFAPTKTAEENLKKEGVVGRKVKVLGDVMYDAALYYKEYAKEPAWFEGLGVLKGAYLLCTIHRAENTGDPIRLRAIFEGLRISNLLVILPLHPRTRKVIAELGLVIPCNVFVVDPVGYLQMVWLEVNCSLVITDSGGVQKEAYFHSKRCITLRDETEWVELVNASVNVLVGADSIKIADEIARASDAEFIPSLYGTGNSGEQIVSCL